MEPLKVLFHISENESWLRALNNINNFLNDVGTGGAEIQVVANAAAVTAYYGDRQNTALLEQMNELAGKGVKFTACRNALKAHSLEENMRPDFVDVVPAGITEIVRKQKLGFAYIKP